MNNKKYLALDAIRFSLKMFRKHHYFLLKLSVAAGLLLWGAIVAIYSIQYGSVTYDDLRMIVTILHGMILAGALHLKGLYSNGSVSFFIMLLIIIFIGICDIIGSMIAVTFYDNKKMTLQHIISCFRLIPVYFGAVLIASSATLVGGIFLFFGLLMELRLNLCRYFVVDQNASMNRALRGSYDISKGHMLDIFMASIIREILLIPLYMLSNTLCTLTRSNILAFMIVCYTMLTYIFINTCIHVFFYRRLLEEKEMKLTPAHAINEDYNQMSKLDQETLQQ